MALSRSYLIYGAFPQRERPISKSPRSRCKAWNRGKIIGQKPPLKIKEVWAIRVRLQLAKKSRNLALFNLAIDSKLRSCDAVKVGIEDVLLSGTIRSRAGRPTEDWEARHIRDY
jgi:hypothetical protein